MQFLKKGLFEKDFMQTRIKSNHISKAEKWLGYGLGPGLAMVHFTMVASLRERFYMQINVLNDLFNNPLTYGTMNTVASMIGIVFGLLISYMVEHTVSKSGRFRPWALIGSLLMAVFGVFMFWSPFPFGTTEQLVWLYIVNIVYTGIAINMFNQRGGIISVSTRNVLERAHITSWNSSISNMIPGMILMFVVDMILWNSVLIPNVSGEYWMLLVLITGVLGFVGSLIMYFYTRERITEDVAAERTRLDQQKVPLKDQLKALLSNKYFVILIIIATVGGIVDNFKGGNVQYFYIKFMLGGAENWAMYTIYQVVTGVPLGIGAFAIYPIAKKVGIKNLTVGGYALVLIGSIMGWMFPDQMIPAMVGGFLRNVGWLPNAYIFATLMCFAYDSVEHKSHMRLEGMMGVAVLTALQALIYAPFAGGFESTILRMGFVDVEGIMPSVEVTNFMTLSFYLFDAILAAVVVILLPFVDVEKKLPEINAELLRRKKEAVLARGEEWIDPAEAERIEQEKAAVLREENRIADLKAKCAKKGLNFDTENAKYLAKQAKKKK